ncbi:hypothetical protein [Proteus vulgaris]|uniref:hypothetical protein n=2 Tax=Morganellaceae TaxID=1903414 RepID=UPI00288A04E5|nr:hypothetical protein [Proteus vulgaris]
MPNKNSISTINPIIRQHSNNAIFYYKIINESRFSLLINKYKLNHFNALLNANIDGLLCAKKQGIKESLSSLRRWKGYEESFIYTIIFNRNYEIQKINDFWIMIKELGINTLKGAVDALPFLGIKNHDEFLCLIRELDEISFIYSSLKLNQIHAKKIKSNDIIDYLNHSSKEIKIALCHYIKNTNSKYLTDELWYLFNNQCDLEVKYSALDSLCWISHEHERINIELTKLLFLFLEGNSANVTKIELHDEYIENIIRLIAYTSKDNSNINSNTSIPDYLKIIFYSNSGFSDGLPYLIDYLNTPYLSKLAFKGICLIGGIDINNPKYTNSIVNTEIEPPINNRLIFLSSGVNEVNKSTIEKK